MINFEDIKKVIADLEQYVSSLKTVAETQSSLEKSSVELSEIRQRLESLMAGIKDFSDITQQAEKMRNETLATNFDNFEKKISGIKLQIDNNINDFQKILLNKERKDSKRYRVLISIVIIAMILILGAMFFWRK